MEIFPLDKPSRNELPYSLGTVERSNVVLQGVVCDNNCRTDPCFNGGNCNITWNNFQLVFYSFYSFIKWKLISWRLLFHYRCICPPGFKGKTCAELEFGAIHSCPIAGQCHNFTSVCPAPLSTESTAPSSRPTRVSESMDPQRDSNKRWNSPSDPNKVELFSRSRTRPAFTSDSYDWILRIVAWSSAG